MFVLGPTGRHLGGSELARQRGLTLPGVPTTDLAAAAARYAAFAAARDAGLVRSAHVAGRGGLAVALAHMAMAGELGLDVALTDGLLRPVPEDMPLTPAEFLFSESTGRVVFTCKPAAAAELTVRLGAHGLQALGQVAAAGPDGGGWLRVRRGERALIDLSAAALRERFRPAALHGPPAPLPAQAQEVAR
ncbi:AIR synthase-related protein [Nannocystis pusilla]|uniref:AIR synthase-related protein n=1 Tax=Nannocystis pusilla TaxID=889268 RepID=UPI003DA5E6AF